MNHPEIHRIGLIENGYDVDALALPRVDVLLELIEGERLIVYIEEPRGSVGIESTKNRESASLFFDHARETIPRRGTARSKGKDGSCARGY